LVFGQHDIKYHNTDLTDIPIQILNGTDLITRLTDEPVQVGPSKKNPVYLYGSSWDEKIPKVEAQPGVTKILVMHRMVIKGRKLWPGQTDYILARKLANSNFDLIVAGDNHSAFTYKNKVINCGSLMRMRVDQSHHNPIFGIYDTVENELSIHYYDIQPPELVLREEEFRESQANKKHQQDLVSSLNEEAESNEIDFRRNVDRVVKRRKRRRKVRRRTMDIVEESLDT
jgi:predicted phosphodiesterase